MIPSKPLYTKPDSVPGMNMKTNNANKIIPIMKANATVIGLWNFIGLYCCWVAGCKLRGAL